MQLGREAQLRLDWLADIHRDVGLTVIEHTGWKTRTMRPFDDYTPVGLLNHHTAGSSVLTDYPNPPYYRNSSLEDKCNITIRGDGTVVVLNAGWAFDSGNGDRKVLAAVQADQPVPAPSDTYNASGNPAGSNPGVGGNAWFIDNEVQHLGNGTYIADAQRDALIRSNAAICTHMGWNPATRLIGHREWTTRKVDPRWSGFTNPMPQIRQDTQGAMDMPLTQDDLNAIEARMRAVVGPTGTITDLNGNPRPFHQYTVNGVWHAVAGGKRMMDHLLAAGSETPVDEAAIAQAVVAAMTPGLQAAVAAELQKLTLKAS
jgi:hypothetical protein